MIQTKPIHPPAFARGLLSTGVKEPLKNKTFMNDNNGFPLPIAKFSDYEKRRKRSFSCTEDIKSAVELFKDKLVENGIHQHKPISIIAFNKIYEECFPDLKEVSK